MTPTHDGRREMIARLRTLIGRGTRGEGVTPSSLPGIVYFRSSRPRRRETLLFDPSMCVVASGAKRAFVGPAAFTYDPAAYLVLSASLPIDCEIVRATPEEPFLSVVIDIEVGELAELAAEIDPSEWQDTVGVRQERKEKGEIFTSPADPALLGSVVRLLTLLETPEEARLLGPGAIREVWYRALKGKHGGLLRAAALEDDPSHGIARVLRYVRRHFREEIKVAELAREARMGSSTLHARFKRVTSMTPMEYVRRLRIQEARRLMLHDGLNASAAGRRVGYRSPSHFNREFKRVFDQPPLRHVSELRCAGNHPDELPD